MKKSLFFSPLLILLLLFSVSREARAQFNIQPHVTYNLNVPNQVGDRGSMAIGAEAQFQLLDLDVVGVVVNPSADFFLLDVEGVSAQQFDVNGLLALAPDNDILVPYAGAGVALTRVSGNDAQSGLQEGTDVGLNVLGGIAFGGGVIRPFFQGKATFGSHHLFLDEEEVPGSGFAFTGGLMFRLGG